VTTRLPRIDDVDVVTDYEPAVKQESVWRSFALNELSDPAVVRRRHFGREIADDDDCHRIAPSLSTTCGFMVLCRSIERAPA